MKNFFKTHFAKGARIIAIALIIGLSMTALLLTSCVEPDTNPGSSSSVENNGSSRETAIMLTQNIWANGNIATSSGEQWFKFTATATTQYIHFETGTMSLVYVQVYDSDSDSSTVGSKSSMSSSTQYISRTLTSDSVYYIKVTPYSSSYSGTYMIGFTESTTPPPATIPTTGVITLTANTWADGNIAVNGEQWFKFTATATTQYIHFEPGAMSMAYVQVYDSNGLKVGSRVDLSSYTSNTSQTVTVGNVYYIKVTPYSNSYSGVYMIGFTASTTPPSITIPTTGVTTLTANTWTDGNIAVNSVQWFSFTATANSQYIHFASGTLSNVYIQVYDNNGSKVGSGSELNNSHIYVSQTVTNASQYYIKVKPSISNGSGAYKIAFGTSSTPPTLIITLPTTGVTTLTLDTWANGNIAVNDIQWFKFTATTTPQYIHFNPGTLGSVYVQLYDNNGSINGSRSNMSDSTLSVSRTVTSSSEYYIKVTSYNSSDSGAYKIAFGTSTPPPSVTIPTTGVTTLTAGTWFDGNIATSSDEQWFKFTATTTPQYIHFNPGTLNRVYIQVYNNNGSTIESKSSMSSSTLSVSRTVTSSSEYYIKVTPYSSSYSGAYKIAFGTSTPPPSVTIPATDVTALTADTWSNGNIATSSDEQWYSFTATAATHYIHFNPGTLSIIYVQVYDNAGSTVGNTSSMSSVSISRSVVSGSVYYIKVTPYSSSYSGDYKITFGTSSTKPAS